MAQAGRLFLCALCRAQVVICRRCDRGQMYCGRSCSKQARQAALRAAGDRYQTSRPGRFAHAARARRYRARQKIVTHQGSVPLASGDLLAAEATVALIVAVVESQDAEGVVVRCRFCGTRCAAFVRQGFLRQRRWSTPIFPAQHDHPP